MKLSVLIPVYNEARTIEEILTLVSAVPIEKEILVVDDGSVDGTREILERWNGRNGVRVFLHERNLGKGRAVRTALDAAQGEMLVIQDADLEYDPAEYPVLLRPIEGGRADVVYGSRFSGSSERRVQFFWHTVGNRLLTLISNVVTNLNLTDMATCYKMVRAPLMKSLIFTTDRFGFEPEITARLAQSKARIWEVSISYSGRTYAEGKKIGWKDGVAAFFHIIRFNLFPPAGSRR